MSSKNNLVVDDHVIQTSSSEDVAVSVIREKPKKKWTSYIWDTLDKTPEERRFLFKLDLAVLTFASLGYFIKNLDQSNINNAFVSGMQEDLGLYGNQLNYMVATWTAGYVIGEIPSNIILTRVRPAIWIPTIEVIWTVLTMCMSRCNTVSQIYALRFLIGLAESGFYPGMQYIIGSWYRRDELAKRSCIFHATGALGTMFSGYLMASDSKAGNGELRNTSKRSSGSTLAHFERLFIIDGVISLPIAIAGYFILPDVPEIAKAWYFSKETASALTTADDEIGIGVWQETYGARRARAEKAVYESEDKEDPLFLAYLCAHGPICYLKSSKHPKYTVSQINTYPTGTSAVQVVTTLSYAWVSDAVLDGSRWPPIVFGGVMNIICYVSLAIWNIPEGWRWACYYLMGSGFGLSGLCMAWAHEICNEDNEERAIVIATMNEMAYVLQAWLPLIIWQQIDAPRYQKGFITISVLAVVLIFTAFTIRFLWAREKRQKANARLAASSVDQGVDEANVSVERSSKAHDIDEIGGSIRRDPIKFDEP
ncbi:Pantothenate transporter protein [Rutstroemia sp. NJR-2017a WRK4]|nr:Pantothenate transporter protein [Rutstroemia sp. NJR-2017a WRK4]